jgi:hypothetical protein
LKRDIKNIQKKEAIEEKLRLAGLEAMLENENSQRYLWDQLETGFIFDSTFTGNSQTFANEGKRQSALILFLDLLDVAPQIFIKMYQEYRR